MATITKNSQILNGNAAISDGFRVAHSYLAKSDLDKLIIDGDKDMEFFVIVAIISLSNKSTIWSPNWFCSNLVTLEWNSLLLIIASNSFLSTGFCIILLYKNFLNSSMKTISQTLIMSWLGKNYQWAMVEGSNNAYRVHNMVEKPTPTEAPSNLAIIGRYILTHEIFEVLVKILINVFRQIVSL
jgi:hypothetical protein